MQNEQQNQNTHETQERTNIQPVLTHQEVPATGASQRNEHAEQEERPANPMLQDAYNKFKDLAITSTNAATVSGRNVAATLAVAGMANALFALERANWLPYLAFNLLALLVVVMLLRVKCKYGGTTE